MQRAPWVSEPNSGFENAGQVISGSSYQGCREIQHFPRFTINSERGIKSRTGTLQS
ncbi:hypothetical protein Y88_3490 [Novosphingobium nitrogenifigens DSM 19370]|uniref:Uncharacterized protein n=1 Tax=Novosphingobium nitrogenifigens DSM 19370 TaxID=983920 RepID=F1ZDY1_9SPHN|nr:hypothetical protein Y88_3490 [Novosphingobium nitrogenifigens DSM 19370]